MAQKRRASRLERRPGTLCCGRIRASERTEEVERSLLAELKRLQDAPVTAAELDKAKNQLITNELRERETSEGKSFALARAAVLLGDASQVNTGMEKLQAVTAADVQRVMKKYFNDKNRVVITYQAEPAKAQTSTVDVRKGDGR